MPHEVFVVIIMGHFVHQIAWGTAAILRTRSFAAKTYAVSVCDGVVAVYGGGSQHPGLAGAWVSIALQNWIVFSMQMRC